MRDTLKRVLAASRLELRRLRNRAMDGEGYESSREVSMDNCWDLSNMAAAVALLESAESVALGASIHLDLIKTRLRTIEEVERAY